MGAKVRADERCWKACLQDGDQWKGMDLEVIVDRGWANLLKSLMKWQ